MRPRKQVLLLMRDELAASLWRMVLDTRGYKVLSAGSAAEALALLTEFSECRVAVVAHPLLTQSLRDAPDLQTVLIAGSHEKVALHVGASALELEGVGLQERVLDRVRVFAARKRGPKKGGGQLQQEQARAVRVRMGLQPREQEALAA